MNAIIAHPATPDPASGAPRALTRRVVFLDCLRCVAAAAVLLQHAIERQGRLGAMIAGDLSPGVFGVVLFFIISGFVIPMTTERGFDPIKFAVRRIFRIYPLVLAAFLIVFICGGSGALSEFRFVASESLGGWIANIFLIQDYVRAIPVLGVTWTLSLEFAWYGLFAASLLLLGRRFDGWLFMLASAAMTLAALGSILMDHRLPLGRLGMVYIAILGCRTWRNHQGQLTSQRLAVEAGTAFAVMALSNMIAFGYFTHPTITLIESLVPWIVAPALFLLVASVPAIRRSKLFDNPVFAWLGTISFSLYLLHPIALEVAKAAVPADESPLAGVGLSVVFAAIGYYCVEKPGQALGRHLTRTRRATAGAAAPKRWRANSA